MRLVINALPVNPRWGVRAVSDLIVTIKCCLPIFHVIGSFPFSLYFSSLTGLDESCWVRLIDCCSPSSGHVWQEPRWDRCLSAPKEIPVQPDLQDEEGVGADKMGHFFVTGPNDVTGEPSHLYCRLFVWQGRVGSHPRSPWDLSALSGCQMFTSQPTIEIGDIKLARLQGDPIKHDLLEQQRYRILKILRSSEEGSTLAQKMWSYTILLLWTLILLWWSMSLLYLKFCDCMEATILFISSARIPPCLLGGWTWMWRGHLKMF